VQSQGKPGLLAISDQIGALNVAGAYGDVPQADYIKAGSWNYSKVYVGGWNASDESFGSLSMSHKAIGALNVSGMYSDVPQSDFIKAGSWNYSKGFYGAWNQSQDGVEPARCRSAARASSRCPTPASA
jgi:hypothetical protein